MQVLTSVNTACPLNRPVMTMLIVSLSLVQRLVLPLKLWTDALKLAASVIWIGEVMVSLPGLQSVFVNAAALADCTEKSNARKNERKKAQAEKNALRPIDSV